ncbi:MULTISPECIES: imidazolonepropionase [unclassified Moraxella]|uniref:imidazolonepropionase n=1 Tax=unclassified Moraxella TaxID=2685852 RepID=UPI00359EA6AA
MTTHFDMLLFANLATFNEEFGFTHNTPYGVIHQGAMGIVGGEIAWIGTKQDTKTLQLTADNSLDFGNKWITPALIDCHTHLVYGGNRSNEFEMRLNGVSYQDIASSGGGIMATVNATRDLGFDDLYKLSAKRLKTLINQGVGTVEIKSGYGLDLDSERKMLTVAKKLGDDFGITIKKTYLALHAIPPEFKDNREKYVKNACEWLKILHDEGLVDAVDAFCESIAFNRDEVAQVFDVARSLGLPVKLHAEQMSDMGGGALVADFHGLSADHIEYLSDESIAKMAEHGVVGVLLPTAFYILKETKLPPIDKMRQMGVNMAVSTDSNPGTSPSTSLLLAMNMACTLFGLTCEEALAGTTLYAAKALGLQESKGKLDIGFDADLAIWDIDRLADLCYLIGASPMHGLLVGGKVV